MKVLIALLWLAAATAHAQEPDLLEANDAFKMSAHIVNPSTIEVNYKIANGYYLYRDKFKFSVAPASVTLAAAQLPPGKVKQDEFFGRVETYRDGVTLKLPFTTAGAPPQSITLKAVSQGCADAGVCYPPNEQTATLTLAAASIPANSTTVAAPSALDRLANLASDLGGAGADEFLPPDQAFKLEITPVNATTLRAHYEIAPSYYLYKDKLRLTVTRPASMRVADLRLPTADVKEDPTFGRTEVFHKSFDAEAILTGAPAADQKVTLHAVYQGCSEKGVCYPPIEKTLTVDLSEQSAAALNAAGPTAASSEAGGSETDRIQALFAKSLWAVVASFFVFGLLLSFTPCVFPMIPILAGIIAGQGGSLSRRRAFVLSLAYVIGMALTYALAGVAAGLSGTLISTALQNPWVLGGFALLFVALALSMFGFYELQLPSSIQSRFSDASNRVKGGSLGGVFVMGALSAVIVGPCVAAPLAGALLYIGKTGNVVLGGSALFAMALGMGVPLLLVGTSAGALLPRAGRWMDAVKAFFGVLLLGVAIWLVSPVIPGLVAMWLWGILLIISAIYLSALDPLPQGASGFTRLWKGIGVVVLIAGAAILAGALAGRTNPLQPLAGLGAGSAATPGETSALKFERVKSVAELDQRVAQANGKPIMLDFYADWCVSCKEMEQYTFADPRVKAKLAGFILLQADVTANNADDKALLKRFDLFGPPGIIFFDRQGHEGKDQRVVGYKKADEFLKLLDRVAQ